MGTTNKVLREGSRAWIVNQYLKSGKSLTKLEAISEINELNLTQRIQDLKKYYTKYCGWNPIRVYDEPDVNGKKHARYFYINCGCPLESKPNIRIR